MKPFPVLVVIVWLLALFAGRELWNTTGRITRSVGIRDDATTSVSRLGGSPNMESGDRFSVPRIDLYGNEVNEAVGDYRVDRRGELYERHAPDTAVLRLKPAGA